MRVPAAFGNIVLLEKRISRYVTVTGFSEEGQTCGNSSHSLEVNSCSSAQIYNLNEKLREREDISTNAARNHQSFRWATPGSSSSTHNMYQRTDRRNIRREK